MDSLDRLRVDWRCPVCNTPHGSFVKETMAYEMICRRCRATLTIDVEVAAEVIAIEVQELGQEE